MGKGCIQVAARQVSLVTSRGYLESPPSPILLI